MSKDRGGRKKKSMPIPVIAQMIALSAWSDTVKVLMLYEPPGKMAALVQMGYLGDCGDKEDRLQPLSLPMRMPGSHSYRCFCVPLTPLRKKLIKERMINPPKKMESVSKFMERALEMVKDKEKFETFVNSIGHNAVIEEFFQKKTRSSIA